MAYTPVPNVFATATIPVPASQLDTNFNYVSGKVVSVKDYGALGDGSTNDTVALQAAFAALVAAGGGTLWFERGKNYKIFTPVAGILFDLSGATNVKIMGNGATLTSTLVDTILNAIVFACIPSTGVHIDGLTFMGGNTTLGGGSTGEKFLFYSNGSKNIMVTNVIIKNCYGGLVCLLSASNTRNSGVTLLSAHFDMCFYPLTPQVTDDVLANYRTVNCGRSYFPIAPCANHDITIESASGYTSSDCLLKIYADAAKTTAQNTMSNIRINYYSGGRTTGAGNQNDGIIQLDFQQFDASTAAGHFENIEVNFQIEGAGTSKPGNIFGMDKYTHLGAADPTARGHTMRNIRISGSANTWNNSNGGYGIAICNTDKGDVWTGDVATGFHIRDVTILGVPSVHAIFINGQASVNNIPFVTLTNVYTEGSSSYANAPTGCISERNVKTSNLNATTQIAQTYVPVMTAAGGGFAIGNGSITGVWRKDGRWNDVDITIVPGGSTAFGAGVYSITLPVASVADGFYPLGGAVALNSGVAYEAGVCFVSTGTAVLNVRFAKAADTWGATVPWTFKNGDNVLLTLRYPSA